MKMKKMKKLHLLLAALLFTLLIPTCKPTTIQAATLKAPKIRYVQQEYNRITMRWDKVAGAKGYVVYRRNSPSQKWKRVKIASSSEIYYHDKSVNLTSGKNYYYTVRAYAVKSGKNIYGKYNKKGKNTFYIREPKVNIISNAHESLSLKWNKIPGATGYEIYRQIIVNGGSYGKEKIKTTSLLSYSDTTVQPSTKYCYSVIAFKKKMVKYIDVQALVKLM